MAPSEHFLSKNCVTSCGCCVVYSLLANYGVAIANSGDSSSHLAENGEDEGPVSIGVQETNYAAPRAPQRSASHQPKASEPHPREHRMKSAPNISKFDSNEQPSADRHVVEHSDHSIPGLPAATGHSQSAPALRTAGRDGDSGNDVLHSLGAHVIAQPSEDTDLTKVRSREGIEREPVWYALLGNWVCVLFLRLLCVFHTGSGGDRRLAVSDMHVHQCANTAWV